MTSRLRGSWVRGVVAGLLLAACAARIVAQTEAPKKIVWQQLAFAPS